ncbi:MAG: hypothetical protein RLN90_00540 [Balneolaceae bacterium]
MKNWKHYSFEILVIFFGISISFWVDEWREDGQNKELLEENLQSIRGELVRDTVNLDAKIQYLDSVTSLVYPILSQKKVSFTSAQEMAHFINALIWIGVRLEKNQGAYKSMIQNSYGQYLKNSELKKSLYNYYENRRYELLDLEYDLEKMAERNEQMILGNVRTAEIGIAFYEGKTQKEIEKIVDLISQDLNRLLSDQFFINQVDHQMQYMHLNIVKEQGIETLYDHKTYIIQLIQMIDNQLKK